MKAKVRRRSRSRSSKSRRIRRIRQGEGEVVPPGQIDRNTPSFPPDPKVHSRFYEQLRSNVEVTYKSVFIHLRYIIFIV